MAPDQQGSRQSMMENTKTAATILGFVLAGSQAIFKAIPQPIIWVVFIVLGAIGVDASIRGWRRWMAPRLSRRTLIRECSDYVGKVVQYVDQIERMDLASRDDRFVGLFQMCRFVDKDSKTIQVPRTCLGLHVNLSSLATAIRKRTGQAPICAPQDAMIIVDVCDRMIASLSEAYRDTWLPFLTAQWGQFHQSTLNNIRSAWNNLDALIRDYNKFRRGTQNALRNAVGAPEVQDLTPLP